MAAGRHRTAIYLVCFHSVKPTSLHGTKRQYLAVETAIRKGEWPYDNGDDPSFHVARKGGLLTWGVCRQDLRNAMPKDSIVVFFSFTPRANDEILYRLCAVATVTDKVDHRAIHRDHRFSQQRQLYINGLITPENNGWRYSEDDRRPAQRHKDWLWRIAENRGIKKEEFDNRYASIYRQGWFADGIIASGELRLGGNYIVFSAAPDRTFISPHPPSVAKAWKGQHEKWTDKTLRALTVDMAAARLASGRHYLRVANVSGRNVHRQIHFDMPVAEAVRWRDHLISALQACDNSRKDISTKERASRTVKC